MRVFYGFEGVELLRGAVCTVGSYDGVHVGHRELIRAVKRRAKEIEAESVVLTFEPHPRVVLGRAEGLRLLTTIEEKILILQNEGVDNLIVIPFNREFSQLRYSEFVVDYLLKKVNMRSMVIGYNHLFGHKNEGDFENLSTLSSHHEFEVVMLPELRNEESKVSSTVIRRLIAEGDMHSACCHLGGDGYLVLREGREPLKLIPPSGRYIASVDGVECIIDVTPEGEIQTPNGAAWSKVIFFKTL